MNLGHHPSVAPETLSSAVFGSETLVSIPTPSSFTIKSRFLARMNRLMSFLELDFAAAKLARPALL